MQADEVVVGIALEEPCLTLEEVAAACAVEPAWVVRHVEEGFVGCSGEGAAHWRFSSATLTRVRRIRELERDFDAVPELAALVADLLEEMDQLRAQLGREGAR
jgi:chaperone modulatory protein CbpM